jgi:cysteinyl-tRNA synthetase
LWFRQQFGAQLGWQQTEPVISEESAAVQRFRAAMDDDFNTAEALAVLFELAKELRRAGNVINHQGQSDRPSAQLFQEWQTLVALAQVLGLVAQPEEMGAQDSELSDTEIQNHIEQRSAARKAKNYAEGDRIRDLLKQQSITLVDQSDGTTRWIRE